MLGLPNGLPREWSTSPDLVSNPNFQIEFEWKKEISRGVWNFIKMGSERKEWNGIINKYGSSLSKNDVGIIIRQLA
jgi:hypothetical protein